MPRRRNLSASQQKRALDKDEEDVRSSPKKLKENSDVVNDGNDVIETSSQSNITVRTAVLELGDQGDQGVVLGTVDEEEVEVKGDNSGSDLELKGDNSGSEDETETRERSLSTSSTSEQRHRSLEALFQVTDTELQAISKQGPEGHRIIHIENDNEEETMYVIDPGIQDREELVGEPEVVHEEIHIPVIDSSDADEETELSIYRKRASSAQSHASSSTPQPSTSTEEEEAVDTPKWRQFKNIERILQNAGIDTSSKTWHTLTRPGRHICPYCQRACTKPSVLEKHIRAHTGERPYPCLVCGFSFKTKSNLYKHCKSRAHTLKTNVEAKKMRAQGLAETAGNEAEMQAIEAGEFSAEQLLELEKKKMEPAQRHVIQEVVKYLEKGKGQRPSEVQTERQRAKLERLKSVQEKGSGDLKKKDEVRSFQRQLSLPVLPTNYSSKGPQFQKIAPKVFEPTEGSFSGEVKNLAKILVPGSFLVNEKGEVIHPVSSVENVEEGNAHQSVSRSPADDDSMFYNQIEIVNLPDPDTDPETSTKALHDLEELSEKFSKAAKDGLRLSTAVQSLPDKRVQVVLQLQHPGKQSVLKSFSGDDDMQVTTVASKSITSNALKERIQKLISANAAIVDTPKVEPPRAKCIKRNMSRQDNETPQTVTVQSETETAVSALLMPNISSVPLQPMALEGEIVYEGRREDVWNKKQSQKIVVEKMEYEGEDVLIINNETSDDEHSFFDSPVKLRKDRIRGGIDNLPAVVRTETTVVQPGTSGVELGYRRGVNQFSGKGLRAGLELPLTTTYLPVVSSSGVASRLKQTFQTVSSSSSGQPVSIIRGHKPTSSVIMSPMTVSSSPHTPGHIGKMALKNLQMKSRSLSLSSSASHTPVITPAIHVASPASAKLAGQTVSQATGQFTVGTPGQAPVQYTVQTPSQTPAHYTVQTQGQTPVQYTVQTPGQVPAQYTVQTPGQGHVQYAVQTSGQAPTQYTVQTPGQAPTQYTIQTPGQAPTQFMVQTPGQAPTQYVLQTPTTPVAQMMLSGSPVPVFLVSNRGGAQVQHIPQPQEQTVILQQTQQHIPQSRTPVVIHTPGQTPSQTVASSLPSRTYVVQQDVQGLSGSQTVLTGPPISSTVATHKSSVVVAQSPLSLPSTQTDPMKILSSIVSNTVNQQRVTNQSKTPLQQPKEIKIEIKLPQPIQNYGPVPQTNIASALPKSKPPLKRQNPVSVVHSPPILTASPVLNSPKPVFRFKNVVTSLTSASKISTPTIPSTVFRPHIASVRSLEQTGKTPETSKLPQTSVIKEFLLRGKSDDSMLSSIDRNRTVSDKKQVLFFCPHCRISFKKKETLDLHVLCYCKNKNQDGAPAVQTGSLASSQMQTEIVSKLFTQSREGKANVGHKTSEIAMSRDDTAKIRGKSIFKSRTEILDDSPTNKKRKFELPLNRSRSVIMPPRGKAVQMLTSSPLNESAKKAAPLATVMKHGKVDKTKVADEKFQKQGLARKDLWQAKLKGQILKRKLKGKLLMNRSLSVDQSLNKKPKSDQLVNRLGIKTRFSDSNLYRDPIPEKKPRLVRSYDDTSTEDNSTRRPIFRRSKSVPEIPKEEEESFDDESTVVTIDEEEELEQKNEVKVDEKKDWQLEDVIVPTNTANVVVDSLHSIRPIYQQNFRMKSFEGMGTPVQLAPSATLTPRPELMEIEKVRKMFSFESGSLKLVQPADSENDSPTKSPLKSPSLKLPIILPGSGASDVSMKTLQTPSQSPSKSPKLLAIQSPSTPKKSPNVHQFSLVGHTYPSMRSMTHLTFCCVDRLQPSYVRAGKKVSMYSNWRIAQQNTNPLGLATRSLLSLYNSCYSTNPVWVINCGADPRSGAITHSSYWKIKQGDTNVDAIFSLMDLTDFPIEKEKKFEVGYKTTEESVYVRGRGRGKYVCETCGIRCKKPSMLKKHIRTHTDLRPYKCKHCKFSFKTKGNLQKHMKSKSHYKKCLDLGISPVPTAIDESQIDEEALQAQCYLSKTAKIVDKVNKSVESVDKDTNTTDDNDDDDVDDEEDNKVDDDVDVEDDDDDENGEESANISLDMSVDVIKKGADQKENIDSKENLMVSDMQEPSVSQTQHNLFLQSLGIIAKQQLTGNQTGPQLQMPGTKPLQLPTVTSLGINLDGLNHLGAHKTVTSAGSVSQGASTSSLSTVYGNFSHENEDEATVIKDSDVIWGLLNLSDQSHSSSDTHRKLETTTSAVKSEGQANRGITSSMSVHSIDLSMPGPRTKLKVTQALSFLPSYLSTASGMADTTKLGSSKSGPIIGQIIRNVTATSKANTSDKSKSSAVFMPFQFQHPFPGTPAVVMSSSVVPSQNVPKVEGTTFSGTTFSASGLATASAETIPESSKDSEVMYVQIGNTKGEIDTIQAQIVNIDPEVFKSKGSQGGINSNFTEIPLESVLQLRKVSEGLYVITSDPEVGKIDTVSQPKYTHQSQSASSLPASHVTGSASHVIGSAGHVTGSASHVTGSASHVTGSASHVPSSEGHSGRFVCSICRASFEEHHQLILHGNVHFLENSRLKCDRPSCSQKFRSHSALDKHVKSDHGADTSDRLSVTDSDDPRPYKCDPCVTAFRLKGHLTKHFRSRAHFKNLEALGKLPIGTWEKLEQKVSDIDANTVEEFLAKVDILMHIGHGTSSGQSSWSQKDVSVDDDEVFIENDGSERVRVEVNEEPFEISAIGETEKYRAYPLSGVYVENTEKAGSSVTQEASGTVEDLYKVKPHKCGLCGRGFETVSELKSHLITHAELRPYVCEYCDAGFTNAQSLKIHLYTHAQGTPYVCGMCGMKFPNISDLTDHCKASHPPPGLKPTTKSITATTAAPDPSSNQNKHLVTMTTASPQFGRQSSVTTHMNLSEGQQYEGNQEILTVEMIPHSSQELNELDAAIATKESDINTYNYTIESTLNNESDPELHVVTTETKPTEVSADSDNVINTRTNLGHTGISTHPFSTEQSSLGITSSTVIENSDLNEVAVYLTEQLSNTNADSIVYVESAEFESLPVSMVSTISSDIVIHEPFSHPNESEHVQLTSSERDQPTITIITDIGMRNETDPSEDVAMDLESENKEDSTMCVPVSQEEIVTMEIDTSIETSTHMSETGEFSENTVVGTEKTVFESAETEMQTSTEETHENNAEGVAHEIQVVPVAGATLAKDEIVTTANTDEVMCEPENETATYVEENSGASELTGNEIEGIGSAAEMKTVNSAEENSRESELTGNEIGGNHSANEIEGNGSATEMKIVDTTEEFNLANEEENTEDTDDEKIRNMDENKC